MLAKDIVPMSEYSLCKLTTLLSEKLRRATLPQCSSRNHSRTQHTLPARATTAVATYNLYVHCEVIVWNWGRLLYHAIRQYHIIGMTLMVYLSSQKLVSTFKIHYITTFNRCEPAEPFYMRRKFPKNPMTALRLLYQLDS